jgi:hypothetical protein
LRAREEEEHWTPGLLALWFTNFFVAGALVNAIAMYWLFIK